MPLRELTAPPPQRKLYRPTRGILLGVGEGSEERGRSDEG